MKKTCSRVRTLLPTPSAAVVWEGEPGSTVFGDFDPATGNRCWQGVPCASNGLLLLLLLSPPLLARLVDARYSSADEFSHLSEIL